MWQTYLVYLIVVVVVIWASRGLWRIVHHKKGASGGCPGCNSCSAARKEHKRKDKE